MKAAVHFSGSDYGVLHDHLFPGDRDEHAAIALAGVRTRADSVDLFVRELHPLFEDEFIPGEQGYRQIAAAALARLGNHARNLGLALISCHSHPGATVRNRLSADDLAAHRRVFPHLLDIVGGPVAGIALGTRSAAGEVWLPDHKPVELAAVRATSQHLLQLTPEPADVGAADARFDRQTRLFGAVGQQILRATHVAVVGLGGGGSMLVEQLAHLGVGRITGVDFDLVKRHNLSRIVGATEDDARAGRKKIDVAARAVSRIDPRVEFVGVDGDLAQREVAEQVLGCDFLFLATDTITSRLVANALVHTHFIPTVQIGAKVDLRNGEEIESVYVAIRPIRPGDGCLACAGLIDPMALRDEANSASERAAQNYLGSAEVIDPSVVTLNGIAASSAANLFLMSAVGLAAPELWRHRLFDAQAGTWLTLDSKRDETCPWCSLSQGSAYGLGDAATLPLRWADERSAEVASGRWQTLRRLRAR